MFKCKQQKNFYELSMETEIEAGKVTMRPEIVLRGEFGYGIGLLFIDKVIEDLDDLLSSYDRYLQPVSPSPLAPSEKFASNLNVRWRKILDNMSVDEKNKFMDLYQELLAAHSEEVSGDA